MTSLKKAIMAKDDLSEKEADDLIKDARADMNERNFKTAKLAGIYAFFDGSDVINVASSTWDVTAGAVSGA